MSYDKKALALHKKHKGKIEIRSKIPLRSIDDLSTAYTPGVGAVAMAINKNASKSWDLTSRGNTIAIVSDGTAVLGLGNIGPAAAMPVMEGKSVIFKKFADINAIPLCIKADNSQEIVKFCKQIEPSFGGINLEDIAAPRCFDVLEKLEKELSIPVFHDDQDGTAIVILGALINACRVLGKVITELKIVISGAGAAGIATARLFLAQGIKNIILVDSKGIIYAGRSNLNIYKEKIAKKTNPRKLKGGLENALRGANVFIGVSKANIVARAMVESMDKKPVVFALANPIPEIMPGQALRAGAAIIGTGRSDYPNQINNALVFPGIFRGLLKSASKRVTVKMKIDSAIALAYTVKPTRNKILPKVTDKNAVKAVARAVAGNK